MTHAAAPVEVPFVPGPERVAVLRKVHGIAAAFGLTVWLGGFILLAIALDAHARAVIAQQAEAAGLSPADFAALEDLPAGLGMKSLLILAIVGLIFGLACHQVNHKALEQLPE